jgi:hypothetical protein
MGSIAACITRGGKLPAGFAAHDDKRQIWAVFRRLIGRGEGRGGPYHRWHESCDFHSHRDRFPFAEAAFIREVRR